MRRSILPICASLIFLCSTAAHGADWKQIVKTKSHAVGRISIKSDNEELSSGSCFVIDSKGTIVTNAHVITPLLRVKEGRIVITFPQSDEPKQEYIAQIRDYDDDLDVAILDSTVRIKNPCQLASGALPDLMSEVLVMGYPLGLNFKTTPGYVQAIQDMDGIGSMIDLSASIDPGNSGGPVFNADGKVIGIVTAKIFGANFNLAIPADNAVQILALEGKAETVAISSTPEKAHLFVNGVYKGVLPLELPLYNREYEFVLEQDGYTRLREVKTISAKDRSLSFTLEEEASKLLPFSIVTTPEGAEIYINNVLVGTSPLTHQAERGSKLRIRLVRKGFREEYREHILTEETELSFNMKKAGLFSR